MKYQDLIKHDVREVILEYGNTSTRRDIKVITDRELLQYKFDKILGQTAYYTRVYITTNIK
jgi:hypothetical protein